VTITRPILVYSVNKVNKYTHQLREHHWKALKRILRYLVRIVYHNLLLHKSLTSSIIEFGDANWRLDLDDRKYTIGFCVYVGSNIILWKSHKQRVISKNNTKAKHRGIATMFVDITWIMSLLKELRIFSNTLVVYSNNIGVVSHSKFKTLWAWFTFHAWSSSIKVGPSSSSS